MWGDRYPVEVESWIDIRVHILTPIRLTDSKTWLHHWPNFGAFKCPLLSWEYSFISENYICAHLVHPVISKNYPSSILTSISSIWGRQFWEFWLLYMLPRAYLVGSCENSVMAYPRFSFPVQMRSIVIGIRIYYFDMLYLVFSNHNSVKIVYCTGSNIIHIGRVA